MLLCYRIFIFERCEFPELIHCHKYCCNEEPYHQHTECISHICDISDCCKSRCGACQMPPSALHESPDHGHHLLFLCLWPHTIKGFLPCIRKQGKWQKIEGEMQKTTCCQIYICQYKINHSQSGECLWTYHFGTLWQALMT